MDPVDFYRLARLGTVQEYKKGDLIVAQGELVHCVRFVLEGQCRVLRDGKLTYMLEEANFMSEAGIHAGLLLPGKVESCCSIVADAERTRLLCWERDELIHLLQLHSGVRRSLKAVLSWDAIRKLKAQRSLLAERVIDDPEEWTERRTRQTQHRYAAILHAILSHPGYLEKGRKELNKYRMIHHIDDENHERALADCGWTLEEFEAGRRQRTKKRSVVARGTGKMVWLANEDDDDGEEDDHEVHDAIHRDVKWYLHDIYLRLFG
jgi:CRP-like cAMP-binding protein